MRVIAGRFGGRRLETPAGTSTRPTSGRVREALFSTLGPLDGERVLDLYAGSGALGIEALSRGAESCVFVDKDRRATAVIERNIGSLGLDPATAEVRCRDVRRVLADASHGHDTYNLVFIDPPYRLVDELTTWLASGLTPLLAPGARVVCEADRRRPLTLEPLHADFERRYGDTLIRIHTA